jgi:hypothetical protein
MDAERTFWEKATAIHVVVSGGRLNASRFSRHWYDVAQLDTIGAAERAFLDRALAHDVATHKEKFFSEKDSTGQVIDYQRAVQGELRLVPQGEILTKLRDDYERMTADRLFLDDAISFDEILRRCEDIERRANAVAKAAEAASLSPTVLR